MICHDDGRGAIKWQNETIEEEEEENEGRVERTAELHVRSTQLCGNVGAFSSSHILWM